MTDEQRLAAIRARADAATPGPWQSECEGDLVTAGPLSLTLADFTWRRKPNPADAPFVARARDDVPWLLALVAELRGLLSDLCEDSRAAREAVRYRRALEEVESLLGTDWFPPAYVQRRVREALEGKADD